MNPRFRTYASVWACAVLAGCATTGTPPPVISLDEPVQAEALPDMIVGGLQAAVVESEGFAAAILEIQFAIVVAGKMAGGEAARLVGIERCRVEEAAGVLGPHQAAAPSSAGPPARTKRRSQ